MKKKFASLCFGILVCMLSGIAFADEVEVVDVTLTQSKDTTWRFDVTLKHADSGWNHYANEWKVVTLDGKVLGTRTLLHPHVDEQPFTRSLAGVEIPSKIKIVHIIAKDTVHGVSSKVAEVELGSGKIKKISLKPD
jgi:hypothetical protein